MKYTTRTEYGLICMIHMARSARASSMTIRELAEQENYPLAYIEKILQALRRSGLVVSHHGNQGGYELARSAALITLKDIVESLEGSTFDVFCQPDVREAIVCNHICLCGAKPIWRKTKELLDHFYEAISLEDLAKSPVEVQALVAGMTAQPVKA